MQVAVGPGYDIGNDSKILSRYQARAPSLVELVIVIAGLVFQFRIAKREVPTLFGELEFEEVAFVEKCSRSADEKVAGMGSKPGPGRTKRLLREVG
jgi:hypothetical protein